jgi:hypothetical protein
VVAKAGPGTNKIFSFSPRADYYYKHPAENGHILSMIASEDGELGTPDAYGGTGYFLEINPSSEMEPGEDYPVTVSISTDTDGDGIPDGDGTNPCTAGETENCDDNCVDIPNPGQEDLDGNGIGDACEAWKGDVNGDGVVNISDVILVLRMALDLDTDTPCADIDDNGVVDISDVILTLRMALGLDELQPCTSGI